MSKWLTFDKLLGKVCETDNRIKSKWVPMTFNGESRIDVHNISNCTYNFSYVIFVTNTKKSINVNYVVDVSRDSKNCHIYLTCIWQFLCDYTWYGAIIDVVTFLAFV